MTKTAIEKLGDAIVQALEEAPVSDVLCILTGSFVSLTEELMRRHGHDLTKSIKIDGGQNRDITIHPEKGVATATEPEVSKLRNAVQAMLAIHDEPAGFVGKYGKELDALIKAQQGKVDAAITLAREALSTQAQAQELPDQQEIERLRKQVWEFTEAAGIQLAEILRLTQELDGLKEQELPDERAAFESWAIPLRYEVGHQSQNGEYIGGATSVAWKAWQARASLTTGAALAASHAPKSTWQFSQSEIAVGVRYWLALQDGSVVHGYYESHSFWTNVGVIQSEQVAAYSDFVVPSHPASEVRDV